MDFDEYEYLEKTVENPDPPKDLPEGRNGADPPDEKKHRRSSRNGNGEEGRDAKRTKSEERHRDRGSSRHREDKEKERRRSSREERNGKERDRGRESDKDKDRDKDKDKDKDKERDRGRESDRDREREKREREKREMERELEEERKRSRRSRSRSERHLDLDREKLREKSRDREYREREGHGRHHKEKKDEAAEPEADPERDQRTVFAYQINLKADERDVYEFFSRAGKVRDVRLIMDRNSRRSKGVGYIEFYDAMSVPMAIALTGQKLLGQAVMVKPSEAEKNLVQSTSTAAGGAAGVAGAQSGGARKLYVGNLHFNITEDQLRQVFESFGAVELVQLPLDPETGHCKGFGFVQFARLEDARAAQSINGQLEIAGRTIKVSAVTDQVGMQDAGANAGDLDDDEGGGLALNARSRALLMQKLDRSGTATSVVNTLPTPAANPALLPPPTGSLLNIPSIVNPLAQPSLPALAGLPGSFPVGAVPIPSLDSIGVPSECLLLKNMFDPSIETEPDFDLDIKEDVQDECSKYGAVKHIFVDKNTAGFVYLRFDNATSSANAQRALHGRWFAGKMITATFMPPQDYEAKFPGSVASS